MYFILLVRKFFSSDAPDGDGTTLPPEVDLTGDAASDDENFADDGAEEDEDTVTLVDVDGTERDFTFLAVVELEDGSTFAALTPAEEDEGSENTEVFLFHYEEGEDGEEAFSPIEDEELFVRVQAAAEELFKQLDGSEELHEVELGEPKP